MNPYLYPSQGGGGGWMNAPGAYFGGRSSGVFQRAPGSYFGQAGLVPPRHPAHNGGLSCEPACPPRGVPAMWPNMPPLTAAGRQAAAECVVCNAQAHADSLVTIYGVDSGATLIPAATTATVTVTPQKRHIPEKLVMSEAIAASFLITGIFAGVEPVLATTGPISAAIFVQDSTSASFKSVIMDVGMDFSVGVTNIAGADARFTTTVVGKPVPPGY